MTESTDAALDAAFICPICGGELFNTPGGYSTCMSNCRKLQPPVPKEVVRARKRRDWIATLPEAVHHLDRILYRDRYWVITKGRPTPSSKPRSPEERIVRINIGGSHAPVYIRPEH